MPAEFSDLRTVEKIRKIVKQPNFTERSQRRDVRRGIKGQERAH